MAEKDHMNLVFIGHVDHGKSTLVGRVLLDTGHIDPHLIDKYRKEAESMGKGSFEFAWVMDGVKPEAPILEPICRGDLLDWALNMMNAELGPLAADCDIASISELFSWFENEAPDKCWGNPIDYKNWRGAV